MTDTAERSPQEQVVAACRVLAAAGHADAVWGDVSVRDELDRGAWLPAADLGFDEVTADDVILVSWEGDVIAGDGGCPLEYPIHTEVMRARPGVHSVVHTHPLYALAFAATGRPLKALSHEGSHFVPPDIARFDTAELVSTPELGSALAAALGDRLALLMPRHGITTAGRDVGEAVAAATHLERACQIALLAGPGAIGSPDEEALRKRERSYRHFSMAWAYLSRTAGS